MSVEEVAAQIDSLDRRLRAGGKAEEAETSINMTTLYRRYGWGAAPSPLPGEALTKLKLSDMTSDKRWSKHFLSNRKHLGVYRSLIGYYWLLRYESDLAEHWLEHVGTPADVEQRFG